jgi:hypothetical protein
MPDPSLRLPDPLEAPEAGVICWGLVCFTGNAMELIQQSSLFQSHAAKNANIEVWPYESDSDDWQYFGIVSNDHGAVRILEYLRLKDGALHRRTYDDQLDDLWIAVT